MTRWCRALKTTRPSGSSGWRPAVQKKHSESVGFAVMYEYLQGVKSCSIQGPKKRADAPFRRRPAGSALVVEKLPQLLARLEVRDPLGRNLHLVAGLGVAAGARSAMPYA